MIAAIVALKLINEYIHIIVTSCIGGYLSVRVILFIYNKYIHLF